MKVHTDRPSPRRKHDIPVAVSLVLAVLLARTPAHASETAASPADNLDARHSLGFQLGGSAIVQLVYRLRVLSHAYLEVGGGGLPEGFLNASAGVLIAHSTGTRLFPYAGGGVGLAASGGYDAEKNSAGKSCMEAAGCPSSSHILDFAYLRAGVGWVVDTGKHLSIGLDLGAWIGQVRHSTDDGMGGTTSSVRTIIWPMAGLAGFYSF